MPARFPRGARSKGQRLRLRDYSPSDFNALFELDQQCFVEGIAYSRAELRRYIDRKGAFVIVAEGAAGKIAGFLVGLHHRDYGWIVTIDVRDSARRTGLGTQLMAAAEKRFRGLKAGAVILEVAVNNIPAVNFYKRLGYSVIRTIPRYYLDSLDAFQMAKLLD
ncbi:MAG: GNAT family N-acetyltransferase [Candidatus Koribacter versatilis]|uniref:GNAT family N-acetyltransferase n=1 Tax=Candidatus Korobacter versatilis TaxID=658062 RepID=A0A932A9U8_9BACT|nr:GNAT family N-acetyltransferase [Candidatus Koribacter versatilis]